MNRFFLYDFEIQKAIEEGKRDVYERVLVIFTTHDEPDYSVLHNRLKKYLEYNYPPTQVIFITTQSNKNSVTSIYQRKAELIISVKAVKNIQESFHILLFDKDGGITQSSDKFIELLTNINLMQHEFVDLIKNEGLLHIFKKGDPIIESSEAHHYILPSGKHTSKFIRIGNILNSGMEIYFIAFCVLPFLSGIQRIYCDLSAIINIPFAAISLKQKIDNFYQLPIIESFGSYDGLKDDTFSEAYNSLFIVSTSRSGSIVERISNKYKIGRSRFLTLFYLGDEKTDIGNILCKLKYHPDRNPNGIEEIKTEDDRECALCAKKSKPIEITGENLLPGKVKIDKITLDRSHLPTYLNPFINEFRSKNVIKCFADEREIFIDLATVHKAIDDSLKGNIKDSTIFKLYYRKFIHVLSKHIPASTNRIIYMDDDASSIIAEQIRLFLTNHLVHKDIRMVVFDNKPGLENTLREVTSGTTLVVGSCISSGRRLLNISRALRNCGGISVLYFIGVTRLQNELKTENLKINLSYGDFGRETNNVYSNFNIYLSDDVNPDEISWSIEMNVLHDFLGKIRMKEIDIPAHEEQDITTRVERRLNILSDATRNSSGLINDLFWEKPTEKSLREDDTMALSLRRGFAFFNFGYENVNQADVYFTISSILHNLRYNINKKQFVDSEYRKTLIDPHNFDRFNDGIIQASILRAARISELHYSLDSELSSEMASIIISNIKHKAEGSTEFMLAIIMEKLKLALVDIRRIVSFVTDDENKNIDPLLRYFGEYAGKTIVYKNQKEKSSIV